MRNPEQPSQFTPAELREWQLGIEAADQYNIFCYCRQCGREWVSSVEVACACGSNRIERISCWQFPDD
jgi:hypothetical protein